MKMYKKILCLLCVGLLCGVAYAGDGPGKFVGGASGNWSDTSSWFGGAIPGAGTDVYSEKLASDFTTDQLNAILAFETANDSTTAAVVATTCQSAAGWTQQNINILSTDNVSIGAMHLSNQNACAYTVLNVAGNLAIGGDFYMTDCNYGATTVNQTAGAVSVGGQLRLPRAYNGVYNIYGGTLTAGAIRMPRRGYNYDGGTVFAVTQAAGGVGDMTTADSKTPLEFAKSELNIYGGTVTTGDLGFSVNDPFGKINMLGGTMVLLGDQVAYAQSLVGNHLSSNAIITLNGGDTVITPEPATMLMLGLGAFGLIRRRK
jgi:hypothetical protein